MPQERRSKYHAKPTTVDGIVFHSAKEARRYAELKLLEKAGQIRNLLLQPRYRLYVHDLTVAAKLRRAAARIRGKHDPIDPFKIGEYVGDFQYEEHGLSASENERWDRVVEDVKGFSTPLYKWKRKHVEAQYGITIREIR